MLTSTPIQVKNCLPEDPAKSGRAFAKFREAGGVQLSSIPVGLKEKQCPANDGTLK
jgi:hypothetical protein